MKVQELRKQLQNDMQLKASDQTHHDLKDSLIRSRSERGGLSIAEVAEIITTTWESDEILLLKNTL